MRWVALLVLASLCVLPRSASARVDGVAPSSFASFRVFGDSLSVGNTLMQPQPSQPLVNSLLLDDSSAAVSGIPRGATIEAAFLFWSGSTDEDFGTDDRITFRAADGVSTGVTADTCFTASATLGPPPDGNVDYFYCRAEVTDFVADHPAGSSHNGEYQVGDVRAEAGTLDATGECINPFCQAFYGGWSLVIVWSSEDEVTLRDVEIFDGFQLYDETSVSAAIDTYSIGGFDVADPPEARLRFFALEGDALLGVPPQDTDPVFNCPTCFDYLAVNGEKLSDPLNEPNNLFNSTIPQGVAIGVDIDSYDVSDLVSPGDTSVSIEVGSGDGNRFTGHDNGAGGGELFAVGYNLLTINRLAPNFRSRDTFVSVDPTEAAPGETLFYTVVLTNDGSLDASAVELSALLPPQTEYVAGSTRVDDSVVADVGGSSPIFSGLSLGTIPAEGDNTVRITFRLRVSETAPNGFIIPFSAEVDARELDVPTPTNEVEVEVIAPSLQTPQKSALDLNGGALEPGDFVTYTIRLRKDADSSVAALTFVDEISAFAQLTSVNAGGFVDASTLDGGANGTGEVRIEDIALPAGVSSSTLSYTVEIKSVPELIDAGVDPDDIDGLLIRNQGRIQAAFLPDDLLTDDPATGASPDPTDLFLESAIDFDNAQTFKSLSDRNGGALEPGDPIRFTIQVRNAGNSDATIDISDDLPAFIDNVTLLGAPGGVALVPAPGGANGTGAVEGFGLLAASGATLTLRIDATIAADAPGGTVIQNTAQLDVISDPSQSRPLVSEALTVVAGADFSATTKIASGSVGGFEPGDTVTYRIRLSNDGTSDASGVVVTDVVDANLTAVSPQDGGSYNPGTRTITWNVGDVAVGEAVEVRFDARIAVDVMDGTRIANQAFVQSDGTTFASDDPATGANDDPTEIVVDAVPALEATKTVRDENGGDVEPGDALTYTLTIENVGRAPARDVVVVDPIDALLEDVAPGQGGALGGGLVTWSQAATPQLASIPVGGSVTLTFQATVSAVAENGDVISNQAEALSGPDGLSVLTDDPSTGAANDATRVSVVAAADLSTSSKVVTDENGGSPQPGDSLLYTIRVTNTGTGSARDLVVTDPVPSDLVGVEPLDGGALVGGAVLWTPSAELPAGASLDLRFRATVAGGVANGTVISNQATIESPDLASSVVTDDPSTPAVDDPTEIVIESRPDLSASTKTVARVDGGAVFRPGDEVEYTIVVRNTGTETATALRIDDPVDGALGSVTALDGGAFGGGAVSWTLANLDPGEEATLRFRATIDAPLADGTQVSNQATLAANGLDAVQSDDPSTDAFDDPTVFEVTSEPDLSVTTKSVVDENGGAVRPGDVLAYTILVQNAGTEDAIDVVVRDVVDDALGAVDVGNGGVFDVGSDTITWSAVGTPALARVEAGGPGVTLTFRATVEALLDNGTRIDNQAELRVGELLFRSDDPATPDVGDPTTVTVITAFDFSDTTKVALPPGPGGYRPGDRVQYVITVVNSGDAVARDLVLSDTLPPELSIVSVSPAGSIEGQTITVSSASAAEFETLNPGESVEVNILADLVTPLDDGTLVSNQAFVTASGGADPFPSDDPSTGGVDDATTLTVTSAPRLDASTKTVEDIDGDGFFEPGDEVLYALTVTNDGDAAATDVRVEDPLPDGAFASITPLDGGALAGSVVRWSSATNGALARLEAGDTVVLRIRATLADLADGERVDNQAQLSTSEGVAAPTDDPSTAASDDPTGFVVTAAGRLSVRKQVADVNGGDVEIGDVLRYTMRVTNVGTQAADGVILRDPVPDELVDIEVLNGGTFDGSAIVWDLGTLGAGDEVRVQFEGTVREGTPDQTVISNQAEGSGANVDPTRSDDPATPEPLDPTRVTVSAFPELALAKRFAHNEGGFITPGDTITYTIEVTNTGLGAATNVSVSDPLDLAAFGGVEPGQGGVFDGATVRWTPATTPELARVAPGDTVTLTIEAQLNLDVSNGTAVLNQASATDAAAATVLSDDPTTPALGDATVFEVLFPELAVDKRVLDLDGGRFEPGDLVQYTFDLRVETGVPVTNIVLTDALDGALIDPVAVTGVVVDEGAGTVRADASSAPALASLQPGERATLSFQATIGEDVPLGTEVANQAIVGSPDLRDAVFSDDPATPAPLDATLFRVEGETVALLDGSTKAVVDLNGGSVEPGDVLRYEITVPNDGTQPTLGLTLVDPTPERTRFVEGSLRIDGQARPESGADLALGVFLDDVGAGGTREVSFEVVVDDDALPGTLILNQATAFDEQGALSVTDDPATESVDDATVVVVGDVPDLSTAIKRATPLDENGDGIAQVGETLRYQVTVENRGAAPASDVVFRDVLESNLTPLGGTLRRDGILLTDAPGDDAGDVVDNVIEVRLGTVGVGQRIEIQFDVLPVSGEVALNQGVFSHAGGATLTDDDGNLANGANPTVTPLGDSPFRAAATKRAADVDGDTVQAGDEILYTIEVSAQADGPFVLRDVPGDDVSLLEVVAASNGVDVTLDPDGSATLSALGLEAGDVVQVVLRAQIAEGLPSGTLVCNALVAVDASLTVGEPACLTVGGRPGAARVAGTVFFERGASDGLLNGPDDLPVANWLVRLTPAGSEAALFERLSSAEGAYDFQGIAPGTYDVQLFSAGGPELGGALFFEEQLTLASGADLQRNLLVDPSGVLFEQASGTPVPGARVFLYYDDGQDGPLSALNLVRDEDLASSSQQGQRTDATGFYRFDAATDAAYEIGVDPGGSGLSFPSLVEPPEEGPLVSSARVDVVDTGDPATLEAEARQYFTQIALEGPNAGVFNNHIPLDPLSDQIQLVKRVDRPAARVGDVVTYTVSVENLSSSSLVYDPSIGAGGVVLEDRLARPLRYVDGSAVGTLIGADGSRETLAIRALSDGTIEFREAEGEGSVPLSLPAGAQLEIRYFVAIGSDTEPGRSYRNSAVLRAADTDVLVSNQDRVSLRIEYDPVFDQGVLLGKVYCDDNGDGRQQRGEPGLANARVFLDNGFYSDADRDGQFHFSAIDPGLHLIKIDTDSLPPGSALTTSEARAFNVTRGLPVSIDFGVTCPDNRVSDVDVTPGDGALAEAERRRRERYVELDADLVDGRLAIDGVPLRFFSLGASMGAGSAEAPTLPTLAAAEEGAAEEGAAEGAAQAPSASADALTLLSEGSGDEGLAAPDATPTWTPEPLSIVDLRLDPDRVLVDPLVVRFATSDPVERWILEVSNLRTNTLVYVQNGRDVPDGELRWDGTDAQERMLLAPRGVYGVRVRAIDAEGRYAESAPVLVRVAETRVRYLLDERFSDVDMSERRIDRDLLPELRALEAELAQTAPNPVRVEAHLDDRDDADDEMEVTQTYANAVARFLVDQVGVDRERVTPTGYGVDRPIYPNLADRTRQTNRRVEVRVVDPEPDIRVPELPDAPLPGARVVANQRPMEADAMGRVSTLVPKPSDGLIALTLERPDGSLQGAFARVSGPDESQPVLRAELPQVPVEIDVDAGTVRVGEAVSPLPGAGARLEANRAFATLIRQRIEPIVRFRPVSVPDGISWRFEVADSAGVVVWTEAGEGAAPGELRWTGRTDDGAPPALGLHEARVIVRLAGGGVVASAPARFELLDGDEEPFGVDVDSIPPIVHVDGQRVESPTSVFRTTVPSMTGRTVLVDVQTDARVIVPVSVPEGFAPRAVRAFEVQPYSILVDPMAADALPSANDARAPLAPSPVNPGAVEAAPTEPNPDQSSAEEPSAEEPSAEEPSAEEPSAEDAEPADAEAVDAEAGGGESEAGDAAPNGDADEDRRRRRRDRRGPEVAPEPEPETDDTEEPASPFSPFSPSSALPPEERTEWSAELAGGAAPRRRLAQRPSVAPAFVLEMSEQSRFGPRDSRYAQFAPVGDAPSAPPTNAPPAQDPDASDAPVEGATSAPAAAPAASATAADAEAPSYAQLAAFYARELDVALSTDLEAELRRIANESDAAVLDVQLPPQGLPLPSRRLPVSGVTVPTNEVHINGRRAYVNDDGTFDAVVELPAGESTLVVETVDLEGNRGRIEWPVSVDNSQFFLMAMADTAIGSANADIAGRHDHNSREVGNAILYGQARLYLKGWVSGEEILNGVWDEFDITAHVDTGQRREYSSFVNETIQPDRDYPVFGDGSEAVSDVNTDGKVYLLVQADESHFTWGNFNTEIQGVEVVRYERNLYGGQLHVDEVANEDFRTEINIHVADEEQQVQQGFNFLRGTGGSIYYLEERPVVEGSERVAIVVRDRISGVELERIPLSRNADYTVRYSEGRIITKTPIPSVVDDGFMVTNTSTTRSVLRGHPVFLEVSYDHDGGANASDLSYGVQARETFYDLVSVGGTVVQESRSGADAYRLWGVEAGVGPTETTRVDVEYAQSRSDDLPYAYSDDGGLTFGRYRIDDTRDEEGNALFVRGRFEIADVIESERGEIWNVDAYYQTTDRGYFANGTILDQGEDKVGVASRWRINPRHQLALRYDRVVAEVDDLESDDDLLDTALIERQVTSAQYDYELQPGTLTLAYHHSFVDDERADDGYENDIVAGAIGARVLPWLRLGVEQELVIRGEDPRLLRGADGPGDTRFEDRFITGVSADVRIVDGVELLMSDRFRYSGENAAQIGLRAQMDDETSVYVQQRFTRRPENHGADRTTVIGGEQGYGDDDGLSGRTYGEYHLDQGVSGERSRAVLGFGKRWQVVRPFSIDLGYERSEVISSTSPNSDSARDTFSVGWELLDRDRFQVSHLFEARLESGSSASPSGGTCLGDDISGNPYYCRDRLTAIGDRRQLANLLTAQWLITRDTTWFARFDYVVTENQTLDLLEARDIEGTFGMAWRPVEYDTVDLLARYTYLGEMAPYQLELDQRREERSHVLSISPIIELPKNFQLVEKVAYRNIRLDVEGMPEVNNDLWLFIHRLNYHLMATVDVGVEYRFLHQTLVDDWRHGVALEAAYILQDHVRLGLGYNFTRFTDDELGDFDHNASGVFFRVTAQY